MVCDVPQGFVLVAILFLLYCGDLQLIIESHGLCPHLYNDDSQIYGYCRPSAIPELQTFISAGIDDVAGCMHLNRLQLNSSKTEILWLATSHPLQHCSGPRLKLALTSLNLSWVPSPTGHVVCHREVCWDPVSCHLYFFPLFVLQSNLACFLLCRICRWHITVCCHIEKRRQWCSQQISKLSVQRSCNLVKTDSVINAEKLKWCSCQLHSMLKHRLRSWLMWTWRTTNWHCQATGCGNRS